MSDPPPNFSRHPNHQFKDGEKIYVIDPNEFDIWEAEIESVTDNNYKIHYPGYSDDDTTLDSTESFLVRDETNKKIFEHQEKVRSIEAAKQKKNNSDYDESESEDYQQEKKKPKKKKKEKPKKEKPKKEKKEKPPKAPKPKKEPKPKKSKEKFKKITNEKEYRKIIRECIKTAFQKNIGDVDAFIHFFDNNYRPMYGDRQMNKISDEVVQRFQRELSKVNDREQDGEENIDEFGSTTDDEVSDNNEEEEIKFEEPEEITLPNTKSKIQRGYEIPIANTALSFNKNDSFPILFDEDKNCNAFIYKTPATQYLILNGMKFELEQIDEDINSPKYFFYDESKLPQHENQQTSYYFYPRLVRIGTMKVKESPECIKYMDQQSKKKSKIDQLQLLPEIVDETNDSSHNSSKRKSKKSTLDDSRILQSKDIEDSDSYSD